MQNLMMMFAIHNARKDWDPLPTALKLEELEAEFKRRYERSPSETELAGIASLTRGEVRRLRRLLSMPEEVREELLKELLKPRHLQEVSADQMLETTKACEALTKIKLITPEVATELRKSLILKFRRKILNNTTDPRQLIKLGKAAVAGEIDRRLSLRAINKLIKDIDYSIESAVQDTIAQLQSTHSFIVLVDRISTKLSEFENGEVRVTQPVRDSLSSLVKRIQRLIH